MPLLKIYVESFCPNCAEARHLAAIIARLAPTVKVELVELDRPGVTRPPEVFSTPTFVLDGRVISLGNPTLERLCQVLCEAGAPVVEEVGGLATRPVRVE